MRRLAFLTIAVLALSGCSRKIEAPASWPAGKHTGRYAGIGLYAPSRLWEQLKRGEEPADPAAAVLHDDDIVIVIVDTRTGEVRQCGNLSGHCVRMSPWTKAVAEGPVLLTKHAADLEREDEAAQVRVDARVQVKPARPR